LRGNPTPGVEIRAPHRLQNAESAGTGSPQALQNIGLLLNPISVPLVPCRYPFDDTQRAIKSQYHFVRRFLQQEGFPNAEESP
jgi:hypothetical protein